MLVTTIVSCAVVAALVCGITLVFHRWATRQTTLRLQAAERVVEVGNDAVLVADLVDGRLLAANDATCALLGFAREELLRRRLPELHPPELVAESAQRIAEIWERGGMVYADLPLLHRDGEKIAVEISASVVSYQGGPAVVIYARDIRKRLQREQRIREYAERLEHVNRELQETQAQLVHSAKMAALGGLVAGVAHELNNPLGALQANAQSAQRVLQRLGEGPHGAAATEDPRLQRALRSLDEICQTNALATERMTGIVGSLRNFARLDEAERKRVDLHEGIESTLTLLQHELGERIQVIKRYGSLPLVLCFASQINQLFMNLLTNAISAIEGQGTITISTCQLGGEAVIEIMDTGRGIAPEHLERVFDPGFTTRGVGVGIGLGLSICYRIVQQHRGRIEVQSEPARGSTFTVRLPVE